MHFSTRLSLFRRLQLALLALALGSLSAGCQSSRPSFSFQPAPRVVAQSDAPTAAAPVAAGAAAPPVVAHAATRPLRAVGRHRSVSKAQLQQRPMFGAVVSRLEVRVRPAHQRHFLARPHATAEAGLGLTVLGLLGMVAVVVGLVGVAFGGGLVWGGIAVVGALAVLLAYLDPKG